MHPDDEAYQQDKILNIVNPVNKNFVINAENKPLGRHEECDADDSHANVVTWHSGSNWDSSGKEWRNYARDRYNQAYTDEQQLEHEVGWASDIEYRNEPWQSTWYSPHEQHWDGWKEWQDDHWKNVNAVADAALNVTEDTWRASNEAEMWEAYSRKAKGDKKTEKFWASQNAKHWDEVHRDGHRSSQSWSPYTYGESSYSGHYY